MRLTSISSSLGVSGLGSVPIWPALRSVHLTPGTVVRVDKAETLLQLLVVVVYLKAIQVTRGLEIRTLVKMMLANIADGVVLVGVAEGVVLAAVVVDFIASMRGKWQKPSIRWPPDFCSTQG